VQLGIGGLDRQVKTLLRRALASRLLPPEVSRRLGVKHVRGILLHGPPGTGINIHTVLEAHSLPVAAAAFGSNFVRALTLPRPQHKLTIAGKTLIARQLAQLLGAHEPKLISGPELLSMWVGRSEENIRCVPSATVVAGVHLVSSASAENR
jgi:vesicle-fusing ATPase